jgi:hypothetical protein
LDKGDCPEYGRVMRTRLVLVVTVLGLACGAGQASAAHTASVSAAKTCSAGYVQANLSWGEKCLRAGEFCKVGNKEYPRYGFTCPASGHLVRSQAVVSTTSTTQAPAHPAGATAKCNDGTFSESAHHSGTCSHHGGVAIFYA